MSFVLLHKETERERETDRQSVVTWAAVALIFRFGDLEEICQHIWISVNKKHLMKNYLQRIIMTKNLCSRSKKKKIKPDSAQEQKSR